MSQIMRYLVLLKIRDFRDRKTTTVVLRSNNIHGLNVGSLDSAVSRYAAITVVPAGAEHRLEAANDNQQTLPDEAT
jgi:hypothetical protein